MRRFGPSGMVLRVRWLFLMLNLLVAVILLLSVPGSGTSATDMLLATLALVAIVVWSLVRYRIPRLPAVVDLVPLAAIFLLGISSSSPDAAFGPAFVLVCYRAQFGNATQATLNATAYFGAFLLPYVVLADDMEAADVVDSALVLVFFVVVSKVMHGFVVSARRHETALTRERQLADGSTALLAAESEDRLVGEAVRTLVGLSSERAAITCLRIDTAGEIEPPALDDGSPLRSGWAWLDGLPADVRRSALRTQAMLRPTGADGEGRPMAGRRHARSGQHVAALPVVVGEQPIAVALIVAADQCDLLELANPVSRFLDEVGLAVERVRLHNELQRASASKDLFLSMVSHELRTPLTVVRGAFETLRVRGEAMSAADRSALLELGQRQSERQERLVEDLLLTTRLLAGRVPVRPKQVDLIAVIGEVVDTLGLRERIVLDAGPTTSWSAWVDPHHIVQIVTNLCTNAAKYGAPPIEISARQRATDVLLDVRDHGPGVGPDDATRIFDPFEQVLPGGRPGDGVGLGLAISRQLAQANDGGLELHAVDGPGACFRLRLPNGPTARADVD